MIFPESREISNYTKIETGDHVDMWQWFYLQFLGSCNEII